MSRETYYVALFTLLQGLATDSVVKLCDRRLRFLEDVGSAELPALFMAVDHQQVTQVRGLPPRRVLGAKLFLYAANPNRHTSAGIALNGLIDAVEQILSPAPGTDTQTLGGIVSHAWISGTIEIFDGPQGERAASIVPVQMLIP